MQHVKLQEIESLDILVMREHSRIALYSFHYLLVIMDIVLVKELVFILGSKAQVYITLSQYLIVYLTTTQLSMDLEVE